jgi:hypothetical protein
MSPMNNRLLVPRKAPGLLDLVPGAAAAYSLRSLSNSYAGPVVTVRRSSDDAEEDFTAAEVSDGTLAAFCGAGDGFVKTWHSQTGSNDASQTTAAYQPKIVSSGVVVTEDGRPAMQFDGSDDFLSNADTDWSRNASEPLGIFVVSNQTASGTLVACRVAASPFSGWQMRLDATTGYARILNYSGTNTDAAIGDTDYRSEYALYAAFLNEQASLFINAVAQDATLDNALTSYTAATDDLTICAAGAVASPSDFAATKIQELIIYLSDVSSQRELLEGQIAWSYSV